MDIKPIQILRTLATALTLLMTALHTAAQEIPVLTPWGTPYSWLHKGLNLQLDLGATIGFGKYNPYRNGAFYTDISALYLTQCGDPKLWVAAGAALSHTRLAGESYINGSLGLTAAYQLNERLTALAAVAYTTPPLGATPRHACLHYHTCRRQWPRCTCQRPLPRSSEERGHRSGTPSGMAQGICPRPLPASQRQIGRASCRERV